MTAVVGSFETPSGELRLCFAFDVGQAIDLPRARALLQRATPERRFQHRHYAPQYFQFEPPPICAFEASTALTLGGQSVEVHVEAWLYDFGGMTVSFVRPFTGDLEQWVEVVSTWVERPEFATAARARAAELVALLGTEISQACLAEAVEDYLLVRWNSPPSEDGIARWIGERRSGLARMLRASRTPLSDEEEQDALSQRVSFGRRDVVVVDWNAAWIVDDEPEDVVAVLEFVNLQLLESRFLDGNLDRALDRAYETLSHGPRPSTWRRWGKFERELERVGRMQVDEALLFERVGNALKLVNDQYLARLYRQASVRFRVSEWNASILRKLETLDSIYQKLRDRAETRRMEALEWIIIVLILVSIGLPFLLGGSGH